MLEEGSPMLEESSPTLTLSATMTHAGNVDTIHIIGETDAADLTLAVNGVPLAAHRDGIAFTASVAMPASVHRVIHSEWRDPYGSIVSAIVQSVRW